jgi:ABC-type lipoprotein release transport system permease subunit
MDAVTLRARREMRARLGATVLSILLVAGAGGVVLGAVAAARRTSSALDRLQVVSREATRGFHPTIDAAQIRAIPGVVDAGRFAYVFLLFDDYGPQAKVVPFVAADDRMFNTIGRGNLIAGHRADPAQPTQVTISPQMAARHGLRPGSIIGATLPTLRDIDAMISGGEANASGPKLRLEVAGIVRRAADLIAGDESQDVEYLGGSEMMYLTEAFWRQVMRPLYGDDYLRAGQLDVFAPDPAALDHVEQFMRGTARSVDAVDPSSTLGPVQHALDVQATALIVFAVLAGVSALLVIGQLVGRQIYTEVIDHRRLWAMGMTRSQLVQISMVRGAIIASAGAVLAVPVAYLTSSATPLGLAGDAEPTPGLFFDGPLLLLGALAVAAAMLLRIALPAIRAARRAASAADASSGLGTRSAVVANSLAQAGMPATAVAGVNLALRSGLGDRAVPVRTTVVGVIGALTALVTAVTFGASLDRLVNTPPLYGWTWDVVVGNPNNGDVESPNMSPEASQRMVDVLARDPGVAAFAEMTDAFATVRGRAVYVAALGNQHGAMFPPLLAGRRPEARDEAAVSTELGRALKTKLGDLIEVKVGPVSRRLRVTGIASAAAVTTVMQIRPESVLTTLEGATDLGLTSPPFMALVRYRPDADRDAAFARLREAFGPLVLRPIAPADVYNLSLIRWMPYALAALLVLLGAATLVHMLLTSVRRRRSDLAVLKTMGFVRAQILATVAWQACTLAVVCLLFGAPLGVVAGRWAWHLTASRLGLSSHPVLPVLAAFAIVGGTVALANLTAAAPGWMAGRIRASEALRAE